MTRPNPKTASFAELVAYDLGYKDKMIGGHILYRSDSELSRYIGIPPMYNGWSDAFSSYVKGWVDADLDKTKWNIPCESNSAPK